MLVLDKIQKILDSNLTDDLKLEAIQLLVTKKSVPNLTSFQEDGWWSNLQKTEIAAQNLPETALPKPIEWKNTNNNDTPLQSLINLANDAIQQQK